LPAAAASCFSASVAGAGFWPNMASSMSFGPVAVLVPAGAAEPCVPVLAGSGVAVVPVLGVGVSTNPPPSAVSGSGD
jgi:hypothetical protein